MPYIKKKNRDDIRRVFEKRGLDAAEFIDSPGELSFVLATIIDVYIASHDEVTFRTFAEVTGALDLLKMELIRRRVLAYEDEKLVENGDVFTKLYF